MEKVNTPLYKVLNNQRENGYIFTDEERNSFVPEGWEFFRMRTYGADQFGIKFRKKYEDDETPFNEDGYKYHEIFKSSKQVAHENYSTLAVNNLASLAEALENTLKEYQNVCELLAEANGMVWSENNVSIRAKEALNKIS